MFMNKNNNKPPPFQIQIFELDFSHQFFTDLVS